MYTIILLPSQCRIFSEMPFPNITRRKFNCHNPYFGQWIEQKNNYNYRIRTMIRVIYQIPFITVHSSRSSRWRLYLYQLVCITFQDFFHVIRRNASG